ncbi:hypothetical protein [Olivibacter sitiensis]|uniref:hypothetical protein n=1 Tax=Olivibacter sitiensis TaxID=376470 RepID=UPI0006866ABB|nr:hypothetical protein [Olivibacter sitiensis]
MKNTTRVVIFQMALLLICVSLSACFEVLEEVNLRKDGTGSMTITLNLSQSKSKVSSVLLLDSVNGHKVPSRNEMDRQMKEMTDKLRGMDGISQVTSRMDFNNYIATIGFSFDQVERLNQISQMIFDQLKLKDQRHISYSYIKAKGIFQKKYTAIPEISTGYGKLKKQDQAVFEQAMYTSIFRFPDAQIGTQSNKAAKVAPSKKAIMLQTPILSFINGTAHIDNQITIQ